MNSSNLQSCIAREYRTSCQVEIGSRRQRRFCPDRKPLILYHRTTRENAQSILASGFRNGTGTYGIAREVSGVWLSDVPLDINDGAEGNTVFEITVSLSEDQLQPYEWIEQVKRFREWCIPAAVLEGHVTTRIDPCSLYEWIAEAQAAVWELMGAVDANQGNTLLNALQQAASLLESDRSSAASHIQTFITQVRTFISDGVLRPDQAAPLLEAAKAVIDYLPPGR